MQLSIVLRFSHHSQLSQITTFTYINICRSCCSSSSMWETSHQSRKEEKMLSFHPERLCSWFSISICVVDTVSMLLLRRNVCKILNQPFNFSTINVNMLLWIICNNFRNEFTAPLKVFFFLHSTMCIWRLTKWASNQKSSLRFISKCECKRGKNKFSSFHSITNSAFFFTSNSCYQHQLELENWDYYDIQVAKFHVSWALVKSWLKREKMSAHYENYSQRLSMHVIVFWFIGKFFNLLSCAISTRHSLERRVRRALITHKRVLSMRI